MDPPKDVAQPAKATGFMGMGGGCGGVGSGEGAMKAASGFRKAVQGNSGYSDKMVWVYSGCQDEQTSADAYEEGQYQGAFSWAFRKAMEEHRWSMRHGPLLVSIRDILRPRYTQIPALSTTSGEYYKRYYLARRNTISAVKDG